MGSTTVKYVCKCLRDTGTEGHEEREIYSKMTAPILASSLSATSGSVAH